GGGASAGRTPAVPRRHAAARGRAGNRGRGAPRPEGVRRRRARRAREPLPPPEEGPRLLAHAPRAVAAGRRAPGPAEVRRGGAVAGAGLPRLEGARGPDPEGLPGPPARSPSAGGATLRGHEQAGGGGEVAQGAGSPDQGRRKTVKPNGK